MIMPRDHETVLDLVKICLLAKTLNNENTKKFNVYLILSRRLFNKMKVHLSIYDK